MTKPERQCGDCQTCCKLLPMPPGDPEREARLANEMIATGLAMPSDFNGMMLEFEKPAGKRCSHQKHGKGCAIYQNRPFSCRMWNCRWLVGEAGDTSRPDRAHYVIDIMPDLVQAKINDTGETLSVPAVQVWIDPSHPDAHRDPALRRFLHERAEKHGEVALIRFNERDAMILWAPPMTDGEHWREVWNGTSMHRESFLAPPEEWTPRAIDQPTPLARLAQAVADETGSPVEVQMLSRKEAS